MTVYLGGVAAYLVSRNINVFQRESENPDSHDSNHNASRTGDDLAALRHGLNNDSPSADPFDLEVQHIFPAQR